MNEARLKMELHKVKREIWIHGSVYEFRRDELNEYEEPTGESEKVAEIKGLFHQTKGYVSRKVSDATTTQAKGQPMLMITYEDSKDIQMNDKVDISGCVYQVTGKNNINNYDIVCDVSLEVVLYGNKD